MMTQTKLSAASPFQDADKIKKFPYLRVDNFKVSSRPPTQTPSKRSTTTSKSRLPRIRNSPLVLILGLRVCLCVCVFVCV